LPIGEEYREFVSSPLILEELDYSSLENDEKYMKEKE